MHAMNRLNLKESEEIMEVMAERRGFLERREKTNEREDFQRNAYRKFRLAVFIADT
jgi:hypothetical protein